MRGFFRAPKNSCRTGHNEVKSQSIVAASARGIVVYLQTDAVKQIEIRRWTAASLAAQLARHRGAIYEQHARISDTVLYSCLIADNSSPPPPPPFRAKKRQGK